VYMESVAEAQAAIAPVCGVAAIVDDSQCAV
jgi:hypothetical protein